MSNAENIDARADKTETAAVLLVVEVQAAVDAMFNYLRDILYAPKEARLEPDELPEPFRELGRGLVFIGKCIEENRALSKELSRGNLDTTIKVSSDNEIASGLKALQSTLKHISWQVGQIAKGDFSQRLNHAGMFSDAINDMTEQLQKHENALLAEIQLSQQLANDSRNTVLLLEGITRSIEELIIVVDRKNYKVLYTNYEPILFLRNEEHVQRFKTTTFIKLEDYFSTAHPNPKGPDAPFESLYTLPAEPGVSEQIFSINGYPITWMNRKSVVLKLVDITIAAHEQEELEQVAFYDALTRTYSRHYGMLTLERWLRESREFMIAFVDMDGLKYVNDTFGHNIGDEYILETSHTLAELGDAALISRLGGDEFMLLVKDHSLEQLNQKFENMRKKLAERLADRNYERSFSFGVVEVKETNTMSASILLSLADDNMYIDKRSRKKERLVKTMQELEKLG